MVNGETNDVFTEKSKSSDDDNDDFPWIDWGRVSTSRNEDRN